MKKRVSVALTVATLLVLQSGRSLAMPGCDDAPLKRWAIAVGKLFPGKLAKVTVEVTDQRPWEHILADGLLGGSPEKGKGIYYPFVSKIPHEVAGFVRDAAMEAVGVLGLDEGPAATLRINIKDFRIVLRRSGGFSEMNCVAFMTIETELKGADQGAPRKTTYRLSYWESTRPKIRMNEVAEQALSRIFQQTAWEVTVRELQAQYPQTASPEALTALLRTLETTKEQRDQREIAFWLGLAGKGHQPTRETLEGLYRTSNRFQLAEGAAEALGMLGASDLKDEVAAVLGGTKKLSGWDTDDAEKNWYLLKALHLLGDADLAVRVPKREMRYGQLLGDTATFLKDGTIPSRMKPEAENLEKWKVETDRDIANEGKKGPI